MTEATSSPTVTERDRLRRLASQHIIDVERYFSSANPHILWQSIEEVLMTSYHSLIIPAIGLGAVSVVIMTLVLVPWLQRSRDRRARQRPLSLDLSTASQPIRENFRRPTSSTR